MSKLTPLEQQLLHALVAMLDVQSSRKHPLGGADEGIASAAAQAAAYARDAIAQARLKQEQRGIYG